ncbi:MAG: signal peptide peptidase SppA [Deltaproteobacteria bacterium]|nr:signal peptide peptidase SppA [Deltaproteobacteria bacterium]
MLKRLFRWLARLLVFAVVIFVVVAVARFFAHRYRPGSAIVLQLDGPVLERGSYSIPGLTQPRQTALNVVRRTLRSAENDPRITGLAIKLIDPDLELAQAQELSGLITEFAQHGKWTTAYLETAGESGYGNLPYLVASAANEVSMMPQGEMNLLGVNIRELFARGLLDWMKIKPDLYAIGKYKDAGNVFTQKSYTAPQFEQDDALAGAMFDQIVNETAGHRHLAADAVRAVIDRAPISANEAMRVRLLDRLEYEDQFTERVENYRGEHHDLIDYDSYAPPTRSWFASRPKIAIVYGLGAIQRGESSYDPVLSPGSTSMGSDDMTEAFKKAREDSSIRAVVFRINSPGGSVVASELIRHEVELCAGKKPLVISMSAYAASGGYWISTPAAEIFADPGTITGSIGVLGGKFDFSGGAQAIGINSAAVSRGRNAGMFDPFSSFTPSQAALFDQQILGDTYQYFLKLVAQRRHLTLARANDIAQGRVWIGAQAVENKLVDKLGGFDAALAQAKILAKISPQEQVQLVELPSRPSLLSRLLTGRVYGEARFSTELVHALEPLSSIARAVLAQRRIAGQAYCPVMPIL